MSSVDQANVLKAHAVLQCLCVEVAGEPRVETASSQNIVTNHCEESRKGLTEGLGKIHTS